MDNFRKIKAPRGRQNSNVDGFFSSTSAGQRLNQPASRFRAHTPAGGHIGSFKSTDGFHPAEQQRISSTSRPIGRQPQRRQDGGINLTMPAEPNTRHRGGRTKRGVKGWSKSAMKLSAGLLVSGVLVGGYLFGKAYLTARQVLRGGTAGAAALQENVDPTKLNGEGDGRVNILLLGKGGDGHTAPDLTDTILVASIDPIQKEAALLSIPRDLWVRSNGSSSKINAVYVNAKNSVLNGSRIDNQKEEAEKEGFKAIEQVVEDSMGIPIHYHVMVDFNGFKKAIDTVGGIDINVTSKTSLYEVMSIDGRRYILDVKPGVQHMDGFKALAYARSRMSSARGDFDRAERQRLVLLALKDKVFSAGTFGNPVKISQLISDFGGNMQSNLSTSEVMRLYEIGKSIDGSKVSSVGLADPPNNFVTTANIGGLSVVVPRAGVSDFSEIKNYVRNTLKDGYIRNENATIAVYNGTDIPGLAGSKATDLRSYGYNVNVVADAPTKNYSRTILVDLRGGQKKYTRAYLEKRLGVTAVNSMPDGTIDPGSADFVIILGANESIN
jgi:LCP family protein required for cell wall assembly